MPTDLRAVKNFSQLLRYLRDELLWPIDTDDAEEITFEYAPDDFAALAPEHHVQIEKILQLRPLVTGQRWGIFYVQFKKGRLPVVVLRELLASLVFKKRASSNKAERPAWQCHDLLFISSYGEDAEHRHLNFAHFSDQPNGRELPALRVLEWDEDDTERAVRRLDSTLHDRLRWPDDESNLDQWRERWASAFRRGLRHPIRKAEQLAHALAQLAKNIRGCVLAQMDVESERGQLRRLHTAFRSALIQDLEPKQFADMFAQTIAYGLFTNATRRTVPDAGTALTADGAVESVTSLSPFLRELLGEFLSVSGRRRGGLDYDKLGVNEVVDLLTAKETDLQAVLDDFGHNKRDDDPVIHFYETFLAAYDNAEKVRRGVFYTPQPVVSYIVRSVHELLQTEFGLTHGLASTETWGEMLQRQPSMKLPPLTDAHGEVRTIAPSEFFVQVLDPATGTATFLVETIGVIHGHLKTTWENRGGLAAMPEIHAKPAGTPAPKTFADYWDIYVPTSLLPRLYGYELMMAPYAIAHMKIALKLVDTGFSAWARLGTTDRVRIYLTNALEPAATQLALVGFDALAHEAAAVNEIKRFKRFTIVIGNPPYSPSVCEPEWLMRKLEDWKQGLNETKSDLNREEWKFLRFAEHHCTVAGAGVVGFIINRDFLDGIVKRRMREHLGQCFPLRLAVDLNGDVKGNVADENVFEIEQGVAICVLSTKSTNSRLRYASRVGTQVQKYTDLVAKRSIDDALAEVETSSPYFRWVPYHSDHTASAAAEYAAWPEIKAAFGVVSSGIQTKRDELCVAFTRAELWDRVRRFHTLSAERARAEFDLGDDGRDWTVAGAKADIAASGPNQRFVCPILYRPLDIRFTYWTGRTKGFLAYRREVMQHIVGRSNVGMIFNRQIVGDSVSHFGVARTPICHGTFYLGNKGQDYFAPLMAFDDDLLTNRSAGRSNFSPSFLTLLSESLGSEGGMLTPEGSFYYAYSIFHSPAYRTRYAEFLKIDFPRLPLPGRFELFQGLATRGRELVALHLLEASVLDKPRSRFVGSANSFIEKVAYLDGTVFIDKARTTGFSGVPENVFEFHIGGYQVCAKWLKDRKGRTLSDEDIAHYHKIVIALQETIRLMAEIDAVIGKHGGFPAAFAAATAPEAAPPRTQAGPAADLGLQTEDELPLG
jgi:hypothetical protein